MNLDSRLRVVERNFELLRSELMAVKRIAQEWRTSADHVDALRSTELRTLQSEVEHLRIENTRLREQLSQHEEVTPALPWPGKGEHDTGGNGEGG
jgi:chromosome segregation ATPase